MGCILRNNSHLTYCCSFVKLVLAFCFPRHETCATVATQGVQTKATPPASPNRYRFSLRRLESFGYVVSHPLRSLLMPTSVHRANRSSRLDSQPSIPSRLGRNLIQGNNVISRFAKYQWLTGIVLPASVARSLSDQSSFFSTTNSMISLKPGA